MERGDQGKMMREEKMAAFCFQENAFDVIRYWAAISVMIGHYMWKLQTFAPTDSVIAKAITRISGFFPGVVVLFGMSGFLVAASYERAKNRKEFFIKRIFRMYPELWVCTIVNLLVVCALAYQLLDKSILVWLVTQVFGIANTPLCLKEFATGSINGSLWTIFTEMQLYVVLGLMYKGLKKLSNKAWLVLLAALAACNLGADYLSAAANGTIAKMIERFFLSYALWFFIGVFCYIKRRQMIPVLKKKAPVILAAYILCYFLPIDLPGYYATIAVGILLPLLVIGGAYAIPAIRITCDLSYEMFLYHWIVLNVIVHFDLMNRWPWYGGLLCFVFFSVVLAWLSWRLVGKGRKMAKRNEWNEEKSLHGGSESDG